MLRLCGLAMFLSLLWVGAGLTQNEPKKELDPKGQPHIDLKKDFAKPSNEVEVRFSEGSTVRMLILQESIDVVTKFGKLTVPLSEVRKIELGTHLADGVPEKIQAALKKLDSNVFKEREEGVVQLVALGPAAYATLFAASKSKTNSAEVGHRIQLALQQIKAKFPADSLTVVQHDRIFTYDFPIVGRITSPTIKAQAQIFGALDLKLPELRTIVWTAGNTDLDLVVDGAKYCHRTQWMDTSMTVESGMALHIQASGEVDLFPGNGGGETMSGPQGNQNIGGRFGPGNRYLPGQLIGKIGESGTVFVVGERYQGVTAQEGKLYLNIVPGPWGGGNLPNGHYKVKISTGLNLR